ncbi:BnaC03g42680D [Brassica napus]|uniref:(rape) hypothetical protein n=1 Tax=Brassica napus TaxID=3708 RepID=A0A078GCT8_BRANA|nr:unnamed protein product [Brassica napus]CDY24295.1 BnaC03g42680D [Brassica napus]
MEEINLPPRMFAAGEEPCGERVIPQLREEIVPDEPFVIVESDSEGETLEDETPTEGPPVLEDNFGRIEKLYISTKLCIIPGDAIYIGLECQVELKSIMDEPYEEWSSGADFSWLDETGDDDVDNMVRLTSEGFVHNNYVNQVFT